MILIVASATSDKLYGGKSHANVYPTPVVPFNNIIGNNFWNEDEFESICRFEFKDYFDFSECKFQYL